MKYCTHCGKELLDEAVICMGCGCATGYPPQQNVNSQPKFNLYVDVLSQRLKINAIIWLVIGCLQILGGIFIDWFLLIVGVLNIISSINDLNYSKVVMEQQHEIVEKFKPLTGPIITLLYNIFIGGFIGVIGSIYYFVAIRSYVMKNQNHFSN